MERCAVVLHLHLKKDSVQTGRRKGMQRLLTGKVFDGTVVFSVPDSFPSSYKGTYNPLIYTSSKNTIYCE